MILDGYGLNEKTEGNAIAMAKTPVMDKLMSEYPCVKGNASGLAVGLPDGQMGNSEVGHMNMGAGRIIYQELTKITKSIEDGEFFENKALLAACENVKKNDSALHLMGLVSDGGVHRCRRSRGRLVGQFVEQLLGLLQPAVGVRLVLPLQNGKGLLCLCRLRQRLFAGGVAGLVLRQPQADPGRILDIRHRCRVLPRPAVPQQCLAVVAPGGAVVAKVQKGDGLSAFGCGLPQLARLRSAFGYAAPLIQALAQQREPGRTALSGQNLTQQLYEQMKRNYNIK